MKNKLIIFFLAFTLTGNFGAIAATKRKNSSYNKFQLGFRGGLSIHQVDEALKSGPKQTKPSLLHSSTISSGKLFWFHIGTFGEFGLHKHWSTALEFAYNRRGQHTVKGEDTYKITQDLVGIALFVKFYPVSVGKSLSIGIGIQPEIAFNQKEYHISKDARGNVKKTERAKKDMRAPFKQYGFSVVGGPEYTFKSGFKIGARATMGLVSLLKKKDEDKSVKKDHAGELRKITDRGAQVYIGLDLARLF